MSEHENSASPDQAAAAVGGNDADGVANISGLVVDHFEELQQAATVDGKHYGVRTGFKDLDALFYGLSGGELAVLAARPSVGKTALALDIARRAAQLGTTVAFFSLETPVRQVVQRMISAETGIACKKLQSGNMNAQDWSKLVLSADQLSKLELRVENASGLDAVRIASLARGIFDGSQRPGLLVVDGLYSIRPSAPSPDARWSEVDGTCLSLKELAMELDIPVLVTAQAGYPESRRDTARPTLLDLRASNGIAHIADIIMLLDRSLTMGESEGECRPDWNTADVIVAKHRCGVCTTVRLAFRDDCMRFDNLASS